MSIERRLAAKERALKARRKAFWKKAGPILIIVAAVLLVWGVYALNKSLTEINYSKGITKDGKIKGYNAKDCLNGLPNLDSIDIKVEEVTDELVGERIEKQMKSLIESKNGTETSEETGEDKKDEEPVDYDALLTDAWVEEYASTYLGDYYEHTAEGFKKAIKDILTDEKRSAAETEIDTYLKENTTVKTYPWTFTRNLRKLIPDAEEKQYKSLYEAYGLTFDFDSYVESTYGSYTSYRKQVKERAKEQTHVVLIWLAVGDELGVTATEADVKAWKVLDLGDTAKDEDKEEYWKLAVEEYGLPYLMMDYRVDAAHKALYNKVLGPAE